jgi:hypothetical protein
MAINYALGNGLGPGKPKKIKRTGPAPAGRKEGEVSRQQRMKQFSNPASVKSVKTTMKINTKTGDAIKEGLITNDYGAPTGNQQVKKFNLKGSGNAKFRRSK